VDMIIVTPEPGRHAEIGQRLLEVLKGMGLPAGTLQWVTWPTAGYLVSADVYEAFDTDTRPGDADPGETAATEPKKRGRPRKTQPAVDDTGDAPKEE
jgi:hypothetical protein